MTDLRGEGELRTPRLTLRRLRRDDAPALAAGAGPYEVSKWLVAVPHPYGTGEAHRFIEAVGASRHYWAITRKGALLGVMSIGDELGYWLAHDAWGQGIATEAGFAVVGRWFETSGEDLLEASHFETNAASGAVLRKLGFAYTGATRRQHSRARGEEVTSLCMTLSRDRWEAMHRLPHLVTPRCRLRPLAPEDAAALAEIGGVYEVARNTSSIPSPWPVAEARSWIEQGLWAGRPGFRLALCDRAGRLIGMVGMAPADGSGTAGLAYMLRRELWGRGIVTEVMSAFVPAAFRAFPLTALEADHDIDNPASGAVLRKLGFTYSGDRISGPTRLRLEPTTVSHYRLERSSFEALR